MNKVITINLNGNAYQLEESGYDALREYLEKAARRLEGNPDRDEIIADIEQAIADKIRAVLGAHKTVAEAAEVRAIIAEMGPVQDPTGTSDDSQGDGQGARPAGARRLYRIRDGALIGGVCTGIAAYFRIHVTLVRLLFVATLGLGLAWYLVMMFVVPAADTPAENAAAYGAPFTAEEFIRRAREGYYEGMRSLRDRRAHREWKRKFKQEMREWKGNWRRHWHQHPPPRFFPWAILPIVAIVAVFVLATKGGVSAVPLPHGAHFWIGILCLVVALNFLMWPLRAMRHACHYGAIGGWGHPNPFLYFWISFAWFAFMVFVVWVADRHVPGVHELLRSLGHAARDAVDSMDRWLARQ